MKEKSGSCIKNIITELFFNLNSAAFENFGEYI